MADVEEYPFTRFNPDPNKFERLQRSPDELAAIAICQAQLDELIPNGDDKRYVSITTALARGSDVPPEDRKYVGSVSQALDGANKGIDLPWVRKLIPIR